jgi:hypothetical protein
MLKLFTSTKIRPYGLETSASFCLQWQFRGRHRGLSKELRNMFKGQKTAHRRKIQNDLDSTKKEYNSQYYGFGQF